MSQGVTANQHYVPQSYLKRFATNEEQVYVFDKSQLKQFKTKVRNVASERYFYDLPADEVDKDADLQVFEEMFQVIENRFITAVDDLIALIQEGQNMRLDQKQALAYFLHAQQIRTRRARNQQKELLEKMLTNLAETQLKLKNYDVESRGVKITMKEKAALGLQANMIFNYKEAMKYVSALLNHICFVGVNETDYPLWTSDDPVVVRAHKPHSFMSMAGTASEGIEIAFPLAPKLILILFERNFHRDLSTRPYEHIMLNEVDVCYYNEMQVEQSHRQIYSSNEDFALAQSLCEQYPELRDPERQHTQINEMKINGMDIMQAKNVGAILKRARRF